jgi:hypothetical protein
VAGGPDGLVAVGQRPAGRGQEPLPGLGELHPVPVPGQQPHAEPVLEPGDPLGQRLLGQEQPRGGPAEVPLLGRRDKGPHLCQVQIHASYLC